MADRFHGTVAIGGQITQEQYARCLELLDPCLEFEGELEDDGSAAFSECTEEDFAELVQYCEEQKIALTLQWDAKWDFGSYVEYWIDSKHQQFDTDSSGRIVVSVSDLTAQSSEFPEMTIKHYIDAMDIPEFPELLITESQDEQCP